MTDTPLDQHQLDAYLIAPLLSKAQLVQAGGVLKFWEDRLLTEPELARMALDFLTAPGMSIVGIESFPI